MKDDQFFVGDVRDYHPTPRTLQTSKFGPYATMERMLPQRRRALGPVAWLAAAAVALFFCAILFG